MKKSKFQPPVKGEGLARWTLGVFLSKKIAMATGSFKEQAFSVHSIDKNPVRLNMAVP